MSRTEAYLMVVLLILVGVVAVTKDTVKVYPVVEKVLLIPIDNCPVVDNFPINPETEI